MCICLYFNGDWLNFRFCSDFFLEALLCSSIYKFFTRCVFYWLNNRTKQLYKCFTLCDRSLYKIIGNKWNQKIKHFIVRLFKLLVLRRCLWNNKSAWLWALVLLLVILLFRKIFWRIPPVGIVYSWKEIELRWTTVILQTSTSAGPSADLPVCLLCDLWCLVLSSFSDSGAQSQINTNPGGSAAEHWANWWPVKGGGQSKDFDFCLK